MTKVSYKEAVNKHKIRTSLLENLNFTKLTGLAGPDVNEYISFMKSIGFKDIISYEYERNVFLHQLCTIEKKLKIEFGDINDSKINNTRFYDLDYCCTIDSLNLNWLNKIDNYLLTLAVRGLGYDYTISTFKDNCINDGFKYKFEKYCDTSPMLCILKTKVN